MRAKSKPRPRTKPPEERREELMNAAQSLFLKHGVVSTTIEQITTRADLAKGTFYLYFSSKEDILAALGDRFAELLLARIKAATAQKKRDDWKGRLATWAESCVEGYLDSIQLHDVLFYSYRPPTREGLVDNIVIDDLVELLQAGMEAGAWSIEEPRSTAVFLFSGLHGMVDDLVTKEKQINRGRLASRVESLYSRAVGLSLR